MAVRPEGIGLRPESLAFPQRDPVSGNGTRYGCGCIWLGVSEIIAWAGLGCGSAWPFGSGLTVRLAALPMVERSDQWPGPEDQVVVMVAAGFAPLVSQYRAAVSVSSLGDGEPPRPEPNRRAIPSGEFPPPAAA
jgi:hypothetical protein